MKFLLYGLRLAVLMIVLFFAHMIGAMVAGMAGDGGGAAAGTPDAPVDKAAEAAESLLLLLAVVVMCALETVVLAYPIARARWGGWKLVGTVFLLVFGIMSFQSQIEAMFFGVLPWKTTVRILAMGGLVAAVFAPLAVLILGRWKSPPEPASAPPRLSAPQWGLRLGGVAVFYVVLYTAFGHFVAWQSPAVREYYGGGSGDGGLGELGLFVIPWLGPFQAFRGLLWAGLGLLVIYMMRGRWWEKGLATGLLFAVLMNAQLLLPNPYMPEAVRMVHLVETASSNFILGWWIAWLFRGLSSSSAP